MDTYITTIAIIIAAAAIGHALDVRARNKELRSVNEKQRKDCVQLAQTCGRLMAQRQMFIPAQDLEAWLAEEEWPEEIDVEKRRAA